MALDYPVFRLRDGARVPDSQLYGRADGRKFTGAELLHLLTWINGLPGFKVWEHNKFGGVRLSAHTDRSWHALVDGDGLSLAADVNYYPAADEAKRLTADVIPTLERIGIGWQFARDGHVPHHDDHLHVDVGPIGRAGGPAPHHGLFKASRKADPFAVVKSGTAREPREMLTYRGMTGARVEMVQRAAGAPVDRKYGPETERYVTRLQRRLGVTPDARWGPITARAYLADVGTLRRGDRGPAVYVIQYACLPGLRKSGHDGVFGAHTEDSVKECQRWARITVDGVAGPQFRAHVIR